MKAIALTFVLVACASKPASDPAPAPTPMPAAPSELPTTKLAPLTEPPVEGISYWAQPTRSLDTFLADSGARDLERIEVATPTAFIRALGSNRVIVLTPGRYVFEDSNKLGSAADKAQLPRYSAQSDHYSTDSDIHDLENLLIVSAGPTPAILLQPDTYAHALSFLRVKGVRLHNVVVGHRPEKGFCRGGVIKFVESSDIAITESTLFGSGTEGLTLISVDGLILKDSVITDTTEQLSTFSHSRGIVFDGVELVGNVGDLLRGFAIYKSEAVLKNSVIADNKPLSWDKGVRNYGMLFFVDGDYDIGRWHVETPKPLSPAIAESRVELIDVKVDGASTTRILGE